MRKENIKSCKTVEKCQHKGNKIRQHKAWLFTIEEIAIICENCGKELRTEHH